MHGVFGIGCQRGRVWCHSKDIKKSVYEGEIDRGRNLYEDRVFSDRIQLQVIEGVFYLKKTNLDRTSEGVLLDEKL